MARRFTTRIEKLMHEHHTGTRSQRSVMKALRLGRDYNTFYRWFYRAAMHGKHAQHDITTNSQSDPKAS